MYNVDTFILMLTIILCVALTGIVILIFLVEKINVEKEKSSLTYLYEDNDPINKR